MESKDAIITVVEEEDGSKAPLSTVTSQDQGSDTFLIDFDGDLDPSNPVNWSASYKWSLIVLISLMTMIV